MAEFLIQALNETAPLRYWRGDVIGIYEDGVCIEPPSSGKVIVKVPGLAKADAESQGAEWWQRISFSILSSDLVTDSFRLTVSATEFNPTSGIGKLVAGKIEPFLENWGATGVTFASDSVTFDIKILDAIKSAGFWWGIDRTGLTFSELNYAQATGVHRCRVNYSGSGLTAEELKDFINQNGGTVTGENVGNKTITFDMVRTVVYEAFQNDVRQRVERMIVRRKFRLSEAAMQVIEADPQRWLTVGMGQYNTYWKNKLAE